MTRQTHTTRGRCLLLKRGITHHTLLKINTLSLFQFFCFSNHYSEDFFFSIFRNGNKLYFFIFLFQELSSQIYLNLIFAQSVRTHPFIIFQAERKYSYWKLMSNEKSYIWLRVKQRVHTRPKMLCLEPFAQSTSIFATFKWLIQLSAIHSKWRMESYAQIHEY